MAATADPGPIAPATRAHNSFLIELTVIRTLGGLLVGYDTGAAAATCPLFLAHR